MKTFFAVSCLLAVASAQFHGGYNPAPQQHAGPTGGYQGPLHVPVLNAHGVPQEPAAVVQARNAHLANFGGAQESSGHDQYQQQGQYQEPQQYQQQGQYQEPQQYNQQGQYQAQPQYQGQQQHRQVPQAKIGPDGFPQDAPDVAAARAQHFALFAEANARNGAPQQQQQHYAPAPQYNQAPQQQYNPAPQQHYAPAPQHGLPQDTPDVAAAKAAHFAAHAALPPSAPQQHY